MAQLSMVRKKEKVVYKKKLTKSEEGLPFLLRFFIWVR
jgi:hypothetical protein